MILFSCRDAVCLVAFPYFNIGVNAATFAKIEGSISNKLMKILRLILIHISPEHAEVTYSKGNCDRYDNFLIIPENDCAS